MNQHHYNQHCKRHRFPRACQNGFTVISVFANLAYAGMKAQGNNDTFSRTFAFIAGFPGTLLTYNLVEEGSQRAYGVDLPRRQIQPLKTSQDPPQK